ncbi:carbamoyltransferase HypF [uncultured Eubacterium sp.]|uniref:carbamoyltransferase HypF n=1 Tax=uncultured Eubacterium sp. TaxID=165185 RepID=UPI002590B7B5|nr:carbamoyltransferase HypF [uncultured Eubacterium sp.]
MTKKYTFSGIVQGIGFRPTALRLAQELDIKGEVKNTGGNVEIIAQAENEALEEFIRRLIGLFNIKSFNQEITENKNYTQFKIIHSTNDNDIPFITPDLATCPNCERELKDENNRRYNHPFISCINCGARYTIINTLPYDRENITMSVFPLCDECQKEYTTPQDIRCHAQTIACNDCGPATNITINEAVQTLKNGEILAIKDIGGYHLSCLCETECATKLREIKGRETKPFAVMFKDIDEIEEYCEISDKERELLLSPARPIVLLKAKKEFPIGVCDNSDFIGAFLPCNPIQILILDKVSPLIMTSANLSGEPIIIDNEEIKKFGVKILSHNRKILTPLDDSVVQINAGEVQFIRRARGYVPLAVDVGTKAKSDILALGGDLKSSFAIMHGNYVYPSQYFGDLEDAKCFEAYKNNIDRFCRLHSFTPEKTVCDMHPLYYSSTVAKADCKYQHHLAHAYSVIAEHGLKGDVLSFVFDGTGYGTDGAIWGGEVFFNRERVEHLEYTKMLASDEVSKNADICLACYDGSNPLVKSAIEHNINTVNSSSMGRLFDAVASVLDICHYNSYEGECAIALERTARKATKAFELTPTLSPKAIIEEIKNANAPKEEIALGFHHMLARLILNIAKKYNANQVTLSGGCFNNRILTKRTFELLKQNNIKVYINNKVPSGDQGLCLGQAYLTALDEQKEV